MTQSSKSCILKRYAEVTQREARPSKCAKEDKDSVVIDVSGLTNFWTFWNAKHVKILFVHDVERNIIPQVNASMVQTGEKL